MAYGKFIWVKVLNESNTSFEVLENEVLKICSQQYKKHCHKREILKNAIWDGAYALKLKAQGCAERAKERGLLLYCWEATKVLHDMENESNT